MLHIRVSSLIFGKGNSDFLPEINLQLLSRKVAVRELIAQTVEKQLNALQDKSLSLEEINRKMNAQYLEDRDIEQQQCSGKIALARPEDSQMPALEREINKALQAFKNRRFKIFIDGDEVLDINEICTLKEDSNIKFVRLIPLVGG